MKHSEKLKLAKSMAKRGETSVFTSFSWLNRKMYRFMKERSKCNEN